MLASTVEAIGDQISPRLQARRQMERLRRSEAAPQRMAVIAGGAMLALMLLRRRRRHRKGESGGA